MKYLKGSRIETNRPKQKILQYSLFVHPTYEISIVFVFSWDHRKSQEKQKTMLIQNLGGIFRFGQCYGEISTRI